ncbi:Paf1-domain-containing protein [Powellomyces hirtus]|nr:Paf1-domain-containing protein [Powellomyces hirtus]
MSKKEQKRYGGDWAFRYVYRNELPEYTSEPKLLAYPFPVDRHYRYEPGTGSVADKFLFEVCGRNVENGVPCAPLSMGFLADRFYRPDEKLVPQQLSPEDEELLAPPFEPEQGAVSAVPAAHSNVLFIKQGRINMAGDPRTYGQSSGPSRPKTIDPGHIPHTAAQKLALITNTFDTVKHFTVDNLKHPSGRPLKAVEIIPIFPDFSSAWSDPLALSVFDTDPLEKGLNVKQSDPGPDKQIALEEAILKPMKNPHNPHDEFMGYYTPTPDSVAKLAEKRKRQLDQPEDETQEEQELEYPLVRDFLYQKSDNNNKQLVWRVDTRNGGVFYKRVPTRFNFKRRRAKRQNEAEDTWDRPTLLEVTRRPLDADNLQRRRAILKEDLGIDHDGDSGESAGSKSSTRSSPLRDDGTRDEAVEMEL